MAKQEFEKQESYKIEQKNQSINDGKNYWDKKAHIFCRNCNTLLLTSKQCFEIVQAKREQWIKEGFWNKHSLHSSLCEVNCPECKTANFLTFMVMQYVNSKKELRYKSQTLQFRTKASMTDFINKLPKPKPFVFR
jgi:phage FluMu protein Com